MKRRAFDGLLADWAFIMTQIASESCFPSATTIGRCVELGAVGASIRSGGRLESNYWPKHDLILMHNAIKELEIEDRNILIMKRVYGEGWAKIGRQIGVERWQVRNRLESIENNLFKRLQ